ncbi:MAG: M23 family metallopeptidase [Alistipes sp.]|jgi:murein DD-endopeptidase MepM/ murein hydrolase activator NlpD|nr:M23 family metallopeptidase [Alistipes sp.]
MSKKELKRAKREAKRERTSLSIRYGIYTVLRYLLLGFILVSVANLVFTYAFYTPKMYNIGRGNAELFDNYRILDEKIRSTTRVLDELKHRDNMVYRSLFGADTLDIAGVYLDYPAARYAEFADDHFAPLITSTWRDLDRFARRLYLQSVSLDELQTLASDKEQMATAIPALLPIDIRKFRGVGPFGMRLHPIHGRYQMHRGIDLGGSRGDPIYATGDGFVSFVGTNGGYGRSVVVDHGFGYRTRYAHLSEYLVTEGQFVKRGELIAEMGSTGTSTSTHLHYEVLYGGRQVNPVSYFQTDMDPTEFEKIIDSANDNLIFEPWEEIQ